MSESEYNQRFVLPNGEILKLHKNYKGQFYAHGIQAIYLDEPERTVLMDEKWSKSDCKKFEKDSMYINTDSNKSGAVKVTYVTAENLDWVEYPLVKNYDSDFCINCEYKTKIEIILMAEEYKRRLLVEWNGNLSMADYLNDLEERLAEELIENFEKHNIKIYEDHYESFGITFYTDQGEFTELEIEKSQLASMVASVKIVEFESKIV